MPVRYAGYLHVFVGKPDQMRRYVLPQLDEDLLRRLIATEAGRPGTWLKICAARERVSPLLSGAWTLHEPEFLMAADLVGGSPTIAAGYRLETQDVGALAKARLLAVDTGEVAASGQAAIDGSFASFDQIVTDPAHRRKGLGRSIMAALSNCALDRGARHGVLVATEAGAALYRTLGWSLVSPVTAASLAA